MGDYQAPTGDVPWLGKPTGKFYDDEVGPHITEEKALKRVRGVTVIAHTAFDARAQTAVELGLAPEHVVVKQEPTRSSSLEKGSCTSGSTSSTASLRKGSSSKSSSSTPPTQSPRSFSQVVRLKAGETKRMTPKYEVCKDCEGYGCARCNAGLVQIGWDGDE